MPTRAGRLSGAGDLAIRLAIAALLMVVAIRRRSERWVFTATVIAVPVLALSRLAPLLVLPRLGRTPANAELEPRRSQATA